MKKIILFFSILIVFGCSKTSKSCFNNFCCPNCNIYIQPYDNFTKEEANKLILILKSKFDYWLYGEWNFKILEPISIPEKSYIKELNKYEAIEILNFQNNKNLKYNEIIIGLTHKDICKDVHNIKHYGIIGLSYSPGNVCIISDKRLKDKSQIWKPILHEFIHAFYGVGHCPKDDSTCFMVDAKGHGNIGIQNKLCDYCKQ